MKQNKDIPKKDTEKIVVARQQKIIAINQPNIVFGMLAKTEKWTHHNL